MITQKNFVVLTFDFDAQYCSPFDRLVTTASVMELNLLSVANAGSSKKMEFC